MAERHTSTNSNTNLRNLLPVTAAALACLAGTPAALSQATAPAMPPASGPQARPMSQAGSQAGRDPMTDDQKVKVDDHLIVDLHVNDEQLANVLQMLSIQSQKNIIASKNVAATITANLYGVSFYEALDAILHVNGYGYVERGNFIYVYTLEELTTIEQQNRVAVWKVIKLNYLNATDAAEFVKPLLSEKGQIKTNGKAPAFAISETTPSGGEDFAHESTMLVFDYEENLAEIEKVVAQMDTRPAQVLVEATILQTALNEANAFGVDFAVLGDLSFGDFLSVGGPLKAVDVLINGGGSSGGSGGSGGTGGSTPTNASTAGGPAAGDEGGAVVSTAGNTSGPATFKAGIVQNDVAAFLRLLDEVSDTTIISRPNLLALNRVPARVLVGRKVGYLNTTSTDTATTQTVEFLETGTQLYFRPFVSADGMIRMELKPKVSEAVIRNVTNTGGAAITIPDEISNELTTNVMVRDGQTIVLGGLFKENTQASRRQVPGVGDIPIIGAAFRGHEDSTVRNEIIFMITPTIMSDSVLLEQGQRGMATVERVRAGSREGLLPWSREKRTQQMVVQATELAQQGKREQALYKVQRALRLNHNQPDAIALREELLNQPSNWPSRTMQDEIIHGELEKKLEAAREPGTEVKKPEESSARALAAAQADATAPVPHAKPAMQPAPTPVNPEPAQPAPTQQADAEPTSVSSAVQPSPAGEQGTASPSEPVNTGLAAEAPATDLATTQNSGQRKPNFGKPNVPSFQPPVTTAAASDASDAQPVATPTQPAEATPATPTAPAAGNVASTVKPSGPGVLASFRNVWGILSLYAHQRTNPDGTSSVTSVPTDDDSSK